MPVQVQDTHSQVDIEAANLNYSHVSRLHTGTLKLTNTSVNPITGPVAVGLNGLTSGVTLVNGAGFHNGVPYVTVANNGLAPDTSLSIPVQIAGLSRASINFKPMVLEIG
jgi:hypothetical protein